VELSGTASIDVYVPLLVSSTGRSSGFINVVTEEGWVTQNLPVLPGYPYPSVSTTLTLGSAFGGGIVSSLEAGVCYSDEPVAEAPQVTRDVFGVGSVLFANGGFVEPAVNAPPPPPVAAVGFQFPGLFFSFAVQPGHSNVQAAFNQCGPAAAANGLDWLRAIHGTAVPHQNVLGLNGAPATSLVGQMDVKMQRLAAGHDDRSKGASVVLGRQQKGIMQYLWDNNLRNLTLKHQGRRPEVAGFPDTFTGVNDFKWPLPNGMTSTGKGFYVDPTFILDEIVAGASIELSAYANGRGGHVVTVIGAGRIGGAPFILYVSDLAQTAKDANGVYIRDNEGTDRVDFSFLEVKPQTQPLFRYGSENGRRAYGVLTQRP
jgi:hypothetical protein